MILIRLLLRFLLVPLGAMAAFCVAATIVLFAHWGKLMAALSSDPPSGGGDSFWVFVFFGGIYMLIWMGIALYSMLPAAVGVLISEGFAIRHWAFHAVNGAVSVWLGSLLISQGSEGAEYLNVPAVVIGAGIAAGFAYWAIAGWSAGFWKPVFAPPAPRPPSLPQSKAEALPRPPAAQA
jgi:hypothetical protein